MPIYKESKIIPCFKCKNDIEIKYVAPQKKYSSKNDWFYWTDKEECKGQYICGKCLRTLYTKRKAEFHKIVTSKTKVQRLRNYLHEKKL